MRKIKDYLLLYLKGLSMGMADVIPGISGGTIAFITGIYEELVDSIKSIDREAGGLLLRGRLAVFWQKINGSFLLSLVAGIATSVLLFSRLVLQLLEDHPIPVWSFFLGLIAASAPLILRGIRWSLSSVTAGLVGVLLAYSIAFAPIIQLPTHPIMLFLCGMVAICAMILPGISGAFVLVVLGKYAFIMQALVRFDIKILVVFGAGCILGLLLFSHLLSLLLHRHRATTLFLLAGFMLGSLNKVWPWQHATSPDTPAENVWPTHYLSATGHDPLLLQAALFTLFGVSIVIFVEGLAAVLKNKQ